MNPSTHNPDDSGARDGCAVPGRKIDPRRSVRAHAPLALVTLVVVLLAGFPIAWKKGKRTYAAQAVVYVSPRFLKNLDDDKEFELQSNSQYREFVQQNVRTVDRYDIMEESVRRLSQQGHSWQHNRETLEQAARRLQGELKILPVPDTYQISVQLEDDKPERLAETVNTVVTVFLEKSRDEDFYGRDLRLASLQQEERSLQADIASLAKDKDDIAQELAVSVFSESFSNPFDQLLVGSKQALAVARQKHIVSEAQLKSLERPTLTDAPNGLQAYASEMARKDTDITSLQSNLNFRRNDLLAKLAGMRPNHPGRAEIEAELKQIDVVSQSKREDLEGTYASILLAQRQAEAGADARAEDETEKQVSEQAAQAIWYSHNYQKGINIRYEMERARKRLEAVEDRMDFVQQEGRAPGFARLFSAARYPIEPMSGGRKKPILILLVLAAALSVAGPLALDYFDPRLLSPNEVEKLLGFAPLGFTLAPSETESKNVNPVFDQSVSDQLVAGQKDRLRRLAAAIERDSERNGSRSFLFVPVNADAGVAEAVGGIARELAVLGHAPEVVATATHPRMAQAATAGAGSDSTISVPVPDDSVRFGSLRRRVLDTMRTGAIVLIPANTFSTDAETELLASCCDVVVLTLKSALTTNAELKAAIRTLDNIHPKALAALVTSHDPDPALPEIRLGLSFIRAAWSRRRRSRAGSEQHS